MTREPVSSEGMPRAVGPFSTGMIAEGRMVFLSGQGPQDPATGEFVLESAEQQARLALDNLTRALANAGATWANVARVGIYLADLSDFETVNRVYRDYVVEPFPARTTIGAPLLVGMKVEVDCVAVL
ncbi:Rid family hydrolase [Sphingomonas sp. AOB5]|uniref:RidA family protein n=1 Tax=Sphingomonas sp. AOB5 TaxID=3034017 RepID=UPI0023F64484|nr:Rid family hydrolase [Sphingomonas sp. AOB5]MDF7775550.1 Rid family hydrolase [Sphingomonas sp. AOB5]